MTAVGLVFLPLTFAVFLFRRHWLAPLLVVAAVLQSPSVVNIPLAQGSYGITPFNTVALFILIDLVARIARDGIDLGVGPARRILLLWLAYGAWAALSALALPWVFGGMDVYAPIAKEGADAAPAVLHWGLSNFAQAVNLLVLLGVMLWLVGQRHDPFLPRRLLIGFGVALALSALVGLQQRLAWNGSVALMEWLWASNATYAQNYVLYAGPMPRVSWPFSEPVYASAWYAALFGGFVTLFLAGRRSNLALAGTLVAGFALANTLGATGILAIGIYLVLVLALVTWLIFSRPGGRGVLFYQLILSVLVFASVLLACYLVLRHYGLVERAVSAFQNLMVGNNPTVWGDIRPHANQLAWSLVGDTYGLGVGLGANRASSYLAGLLSNTGIPGTILFLLAAAFQLRMLVPSRGRPVSSSGLFLLGGTTCALIAVIIAIPDLNWPTLWVFFFAAFAWSNWMAANRPDQV